MKIKMIQVELLTQSKRNKEIFQSAIAQYQAEIKDQHEWNDFSGKMAWRNPILYLVRVPYSSWFPFCKHLRQSPTISVANPERVGIPNTLHDCHQQELVRGLFAIARQRGQVIESPNIVHNYYVHGSIAPAFRLIQRTESGLTELSYSKKLLEILDGNIDAKTELVRDHCGY